MRFAFSASVMDSLTRYVCLDISDLFLALYYTPQYNRTAPSSVFCIAPTFWHWTMALQDIHGPSTAVKVSQYTSIALKKLNTLHFTIGKSHSFLVLILLLHAASCPCVLWCGGWLLTLLWHAVGVHWSVFFLYFLLILLLILLFYHTSIQAG